MHTTRSPTVQQDPKEFWIGTIEVPSLGGIRFVMTLIDDATRKVFLYFLEKKNRAFEAYTKLVQIHGGEGSQKNIEYVNDVFRRSFEKYGV